MREQPKDHCALAIICKTTASFLEQLQDGAEFLKGLSI